MAQEFAPKCRLEDREGMIASAVDRVAVAIVVVVEEEVAKAEIVTGN